MFDGPHAGRFRVAVWNIARKSGASAALDRLEPDICLLNEALVPEGRKGSWSPTGTHGRDGGKRPWSAAVVSDLRCEPITDAKPQFRQSVRKVPFKCSRHGTWEATSVETPLGTVTAVALYGLMDELSGASIHRSLSELSPLMDDNRYRDLIVIGGDLNTGTQWPDKDGSWKARDRGVLERFEALGLVDCLRLKRPSGRLVGCPCTDGDACEHVRMRRLHDLRHTQATMLLRQGVHPKVVQERLGHANVSITLDIYSHCTANMQQEAAEKIDEALAAALAG